MTIIFFTSNLVFYFCREYLEVASKAFMHVDLIGQTYLCYTMAKSSKLQLVRLEKTSDPDTHIFGMINSIPAKDAVCMHVNI